MAQEISNRSARILNSITDYAICFLDKNGVVTGWNTGAERIKKYEAEEIIGQHYACLFPHEAQMAREPHQALEKAKKDGAYNTEGWRIRKDGVYFWAKVTINPVLDDDGALTGFIKITRDCTEEKQAEEALIRSERNFRLLVHGVVDYAIYMLDRDGRVASWNAGAERAKGYKAEEIIGRHFSCFYPREAQIAGDPAAALETAKREGKFEAEGWRIRKDGSKLWAMVVIDAVYGEEGDLVGYAKITRDITENKADRDYVAALLENQKRTMKELEIAVEQAHQASKAKSAFLANMSHEIRTPMNGVLGMIELLSETELTDRQRLFVENISKSSDSLLTVINDVLDFSKIESDKLALDPAPFDLCAAVEDVASLLSPSAQGKGLEIAVRCSSDIPRTLIGDAGRIRQIVTNLLSNAIKFTPAGHVLVDVAPVSAGNKKTPAWRIEVRDTGIGIPKKKIETIFEEFTQVEESSTRAYGGAGLGLAITRRLTNLMNGELGVESKPGEGSVFRVDLPMAIGEDAAPSLGAASPLPEAKILLVDDMEINLDILEEHCRTWNLRPVRAQSGRQAIEILKQAAQAGDPFDAILLDYHMPDVDGLEVARFIGGQNDLNPVNIVVLSSADDDSSISAFRDAGAEHYLVKPVRAKHLRESLSAAFARDKASAPPAPLRKAKPRRNPSPQHKKRVLLVEDVELNRMVVANFIDAALYELTCAENGKQAVDLFTENEFDLVLMDLSMPVMDGYEATAAIRKLEADENRARTPIVSLTAHALKGQREKCLDAGMDDFITKPVKKAALADMLTAWTERADDRKKSA